MKIKSIKLHNNPILGNIEFNFCTPSGDVANTIILAGENGCGKTTLLDIIYDISRVSRVYSATLEKKKNSQKIEIPKKRTKAPSSFWLN